MFRRFVVVPAVPADAGIGSFERNGRYLVRTISTGFDIYDNFDKFRMPTSYPNRESADAECARLNSEAVGLTE